jgi:hypothetical protein
MVMSVTWDSGMSRSQQNTVGGAASTLTAEQTCDAGKLVPVARNHRMTLMSECEALASGARVLPYRQVSLNGFR